MEDITMKKTYINPQMTIVSIPATTLLAGSDPKISSENYNGSETIYSRELSFDIDE